MRRRKYKETLGHWDFMGRNKHQTTTVRHETITKTTEEMRKEVA
jgi:hypothetical protein